MDVLVDIWLILWFLVIGGGIIFIVGNDICFYQNVDFLGIEMFGIFIDVIVMIIFNVDVWMLNMIVFRVKLVEFDGVIFVIEGEIVLILI